MLSSPVGVNCTSTVKDRIEKERPTLVMKQTTATLINGLNNNNNNNLQMVEYIVDPATRTTYLKGKFLGKGGFARVHELTDLTTNKVYAGKIIPKSRITKRYHREKIVREIDFHRALKHEHVVRFHHFFEDDENVYIILENCSRKSLLHVLKYRHTLTEPEVRYYLNQLVLGVKYIHSQRVIHRDLKLGNMFLTEKLVVKIGDFGLASSLENGETRNITVCGTPNYIAPEVLNKQGHGYSSDIWAVGCIMYTMLVGHPPFETASLKETYSRITNNKYVLPPLVTTSARCLISDLLHPDPTLRPSLDAILNHEFFVGGFTPITLPISACTVPPKFPSTSSSSSSSLLLCAKSSSPDSVVVHLPSPPPPDNHHGGLAHELRKITRTVSQLCVSGPKPETKVSNNKEKATLKTKKDANSLKQKITSVLCSDKFNSKKTKPLTATVLYQILSTCLEAMPDESNTISPLVTNVSILFVTKWIDYSNKYGFGFQLSDRSIGVLFNDNTKIGCTPDRGRIEFHDADGRVTMHSASSIPSSLDDHLTLLKYFSKYMDENLTEGGNLKPPSSSKRPGPVAHMQRWVRTTKAIVLYLSTGTLQVNFFKDHTKVIISTESHELLVTFIDENRQSQTYRLLQLVQAGCPPIVHQRLHYALATLRDFAHLESTEV